MLSSCSGGAERRPGRKGCQEMMRETWGGILERKFNTPYGYPSTPPVKCTEITSIGRFEVTTHGFFPSVGVSFRNLSVFHALCIYRYRGAPNVCTPETTKPPTERIGGGLSGERTLYAKTLQIAFPIYPCSLATPISRCPSYKPQERKFRLSRRPAFPYLHA